MEPKSSMGASGVNFQRWRPGPIDAVRAFILSENFQSAVQLATGILFVSLFVFVNALRFPGSCVAVLLYIVVAVTAAPDNHVGTRIFLCGFMIGPMWLAMITGGIVATLAKLAPTAQGHMIILSILGPLCIVPFAINRVGTSHPFLWAMGMVSALYVGLPILAGFSVPDAATLWVRSVGLVFIAAFIGMFAGSVLSMIVLPSLASEALEDEVAHALCDLGHHLSRSVSELFRPELAGASGPNLTSMHPLLLQLDNLKGTPVLPGVLDKDEAPELRGPDVYIAMMDWFEQMSRPPAAPSAGSGALVCLAPCRASSSTGSASSTGPKSTFYGPTGLSGAAAAAAAVAAAAADTAGDDDGDWSDAGVSFSSADLHSRGNSGLMSLPKPGSAVSLAATGTGSPGASRLPSHSLQVPLISEVLPEDAAAGPPLPAAAGVPAAGVPAAGVPVSALAGAAAAAGGGGGGGGGGASRDLGQIRLRSGKSRSLSQGLRLGSSVTAATVAASRYGAAAAAQQQQEQQEAPAPFPAADAAAASVTGLAFMGQQLVPAPGIADIRQQLAHANMLLNAAAAEPQWLRGAARRFDMAAWAKVIAMSQLLALRLSALDLLCRDHMMLLNTHHSFPMGPDMVVLLQNVYGSAAAVLSLLGRQVSNRGDRSGTCRAVVDVIQSPLWQQCRSKLMQDIEQCLALYWQRITEATSEKPVTLPRGVWVRQWMFFLMVTFSIIDTIDKLSATAAAALTVPVRGRAARQQQRQPQQPDASQPAAAADVEAAVAQPPPGAAPAPAPAAPAAWSFVASFKKHTAWARPWLPNALNVEQFCNLHLTFTAELPKMLSSRAAFVRQLKGRRFQAGVKYWFVCSAVLVSVMVLLYSVPESARLAPNFAYSAAAVGMSDRVESTVHKVVVWSGSSICGAVLGWLLMLHPDMANNAVALAAVLCAVAFLVGSLPRSKNSLITLFTLMTIASVVLCQFVGCCGHTGSSMMAVTRGAGVTMAAVFAVVFQNLVLPWYTSTWAMEQMGAVYQEAADLLAELVLKLYLETHELMQQQEQEQARPDGGTGIPAAGRVPAAGDASAGSAADTAEGQTGGTLGSRMPGSPDSQAVHPASAGAAGAAGAAELSGAVRVPSRLQQLDAAVRRVQQEMQQQQLASGEQVEQGPRLVAVDQLVAAASMQTASSLGDPRALGRLCSMSTAGVAAGAQPAAGLAAAAAAAAAASNTTSPQGDAAAAPPAPGTAPKSSGQYSSSQTEVQMMSLLQQRQQQQAGAASSAGAGGAAGAAGAGLAQRLQARLVKPLVDVKISLMLDTTAWSTGLYATPPAVTNMLQAMFDLVDCLGALQQAVSEPVKQLAGSWDWTLMHCGPAWASLLLEVIALADATAAHLREPTAQTAARVLQHIQEVQHKRYEFFSLQKNLRHLLLVAIGRDEQLRAAHAASIKASQVDGHMRYTSCVYATNKVLDRMTAAARCALDAGDTRLLKAARAAGAPSAASAK